MSAESQQVNIYKLYFHQGVGAVQHESIALVPAVQPNQGLGTVVHVTGYAAYGMDYEMKHQYNFKESRSFASQEYQFSIDSKSVGEFKAICEATPPPIDEKAQEQGVKADVDCTTWVAQILESTRHLAV